MLECEDAESQDLYRKDKFGYGAWRRADVRDVLCKARNPS